jgi:aminoglycoside/choline kinase family phosphotransferase
MQEILQSITAVFNQSAAAHFNNDAIKHIEVLPQSGSERRYFRIFTNSNKSYIATYGLNIKENNTFLYFAQQFKQKGLQVPKVYCTNSDFTIYIQEDFGDISLLNNLEAKGYVPEVYQLFKKSLQQLAELQIKGHENLDYTKCLTNTEFGKQAIMADLLYFKYYFLDALRRPYDKQALIDDFEALSNYLTRTEYKFFMFRDFQSRNILVSEDSHVHFIDFQGGMLGAPQYDVASLLWQAKANLSAEWKEDLLNDYITHFESILGQSVDHNLFKSQYNGFVLIRLLQVMGAYGFRGLFERKAHFLASIPMGLQNLQWFINNLSIGIHTPELKKALELITSEEIIQQYTPIQANDATPLKIIVQSFSYKKGLPTDSSGNGGGFIFDCRGILNPGRFDAYKHLCGKDREVIDFLEQQTRMPDYINSVFDIIDINIEDYIKRGFENLQINFGCTGGQHRSVYCAEQTARHLKNKYKLKIDLQHTNQHNWVKEPVVKN